MKTQNLQKLVELKNFPLGPQAEKKAQLKKLKYLQPNHDDDYIFLVAICHIFADQKNPHKAQALTSSSSQATTIEKTKLQSYIMGGILMSFKNQLLQIKSLVDQKRLHLLLLMISLYKICDDNKPNGKMS